MSKTIKMKHDTASSFSFGGEMFVADKKGVFEMTPDAALAAADFGFEPVTGKVESKADADKAPEANTAG
ncbi:MAG: hypothetical protein RL758_54 [Pseudomonadota bacterium]|jgi:hypothetical protein